MQWNCLEKQSLVRDQATILTLPLISCMALNESLTIQGFGSSFQNHLWSSGRKKPYLPNNHPNNLKVSASVHSKAIAMLQEN